MQVLEQSAAATQGALRIEAFPDKTLEGVVRALVDAIIGQYVRYPGLMRALIRFTENDSDESFRRQALEAVRGNFTAGVDLLLEHFGSEIKHAEPKHAITFALLSAATIIEERAIEEISLWHTLLPVSDAQLNEDVTRMILAYLR
jgi:hypothetical protein